MLFDSKDDFRLEKFLELVKFAFFLCNFKFLPEKSILEILPRLVLEPNISKTIFLFYVLFLLEKISLDFAKNMNNFSSKAEKQKLCFGNFGHFLLHWRVAFFMSRIGAISNYIWRWCNSLPVCLFSFRKTDFFGDQPVAKNNIKMTASRERFF